MGGGGARGVLTYMADPVAAALSRLNQTVEELGALAETYASSEAWPQAIASLISPLAAPATAAAAASALSYLSEPAGVAENSHNIIREAGGIPPLVALLAGGAESVAAEDAAGALFNVAATSANKEAIREAGGIPPLVALLAGGVESGAAENAAAALWNMVIGCDVNSDAIREAGAIPQLVALLAGGVESKTAENAAGALLGLSRNDGAHAAIREAGAIPPLVAMLAGGAESKTAENAAGVLCNMASGNTATCDAIREAGAIPQLVALLAVGTESGAAENAVGALANLAIDCDVNRDAIREAGGIPSLVALLAGGAASGVAETAADTLKEMEHFDAVLSAVASAHADTAAFEDLHAALVNAATARLEAAEAGTDVAALERAIEQAAAVAVAAAALERARGRVAEINGEAERRARRESFGLGALPPPEEFNCPLTLEQMRGARPLALLPVRPVLAMPIFLPHAARRPGGGLGRQLVRARRHRTRAPRRRPQPLDAAAARADPLPQPRAQAAHRGVRGEGLADRGDGRGGDGRARRGKRKRRARAKAEPHSTLQPGDVSSVACALWGHGARRWLVVIREREHGTSCTPNTRAVLQRSGWLCTKRSACASVSE